MASSPDKAAHAKKPKLVRDSFTIPKSEYAAIDALKQRAIGLGTSVKKSELLRAGLMALQGLSDAAYKAALAAVPALKTGRPLAEPVAEAAPKAAPKAAAKAVPKAVPAAGKPAKAPKVSPEAQPAAKRAASPAAPAPQAQTKPAPRTGTARKSRPAVRSA